MKRTARPTLKQIAELAGVSLSAVSMILSERADVSFAEDTVRRVTETAQQLGYVRRSPSLTGNSSHMRNCVVVVAPNIVNPYYSTIIQSIDKAAQLRGFDTLVYNTYRDAAREAHLLELLAHCDAAGAIFTMMPLELRQVELLEQTMPLVLVGDRDDAVRVDTIETSNYAAGVMLAEHLVALGHRNIAFISTSLDAAFSARTKRLEGIRSVVDAVGKLTVCARNATATEELDNAQIEHDIGFALCREVLQNRDITALVGVNDMVCYGVADAVLEAGFSIPGDYSVAGFDNNFPSGMLQVGLTTVEHCIKDKGTNALELLYEKIQRRHSPKATANFITRVEYQQYLITRGSTAPPR